MKVGLVQRLTNRILQFISMTFPGGQTFRVFLHRIRGVNIGNNVWISLNVMLETEYPSLITIGDNTFLGVGVVVIAHFKELRSGIHIGKECFIGPGVILLPDVQIGDGSVVTAGSVVTSSVPPMTVVQGNPAVPIAKCGVPLWPDTPMTEFSRRLKPVTRSSARSPAAKENRKD
jgi:acetyltransferase-like isoleucine patch superfamily enzyme